jgi:hypothetical protein
MRRLIPESLRRLLRRAKGVDMGDLRSPEPPSRIFGLDRGLPIDRWYIERFLAANASLIRGRVLEVADDAYTRRFGGDRVTQRDVLHATPGNASATIVGDLATGEGIPRDCFDAIVLTQVLQFIPDFAAATRTAHLALASGGALLATTTLISPISRYDADRWGEYWRPTQQAAQRLFGEVFGAANVTVTSHGNHTAAHAAISGMAAEELSDSELAPTDPDYPVVIAIVALKR